VYRFYERGQNRFGVNHLVDVLRGKETDKVNDYQHQNLSTFGIGADLSEGEWRALIRQLVALGYLRAEGEFNTLELTQASRVVLRGETTLRLRKPSEAPRKKRSKAAQKQAAAPPVPLDATATQRFAALKAWRAGVARERNLPAYVVFHDATLIEMARSAPASLSALGAITGVGTKKLEAYGADILKVLAAG
jgi:ATP-dependent DNA helicase RecQ